MEFEAHRIPCVCLCVVVQVRQEEKWESGEGRLLPEFKCYKELYQNKITQQESLSKQLRKQQKTIKENEASYTEQVGLHSIPDDTDRKRSGG